MAHKILYVPLIKDRMRNFVTNPQEVSHFHAHIYNRDRRGPYSPRSLFFPLCRVVGAHFLLQMTKIWQRG